MFQERCVSPFDVSRLVYWVDCDILQQVATAVRQHRMAVDKKRACIELTTKPTDQYVDAAAERSAGKIVAHLIRLSRRPEKPNDSGDHAPHKCVTRTSSICLSGVFAPHKIVF